MRATKLVLAFYTVWILLHYICVFIKMYFTEPLLTQTHLLP
jgi:hypothetical protein